MSKEIKKAKLSRFNSENRIGDHFGDVTEMVALGSGAKRLVRTIQMRSRSTIEFLSLWEKLSNPDFKPIEFERFRSEAGSNYFVP